MAHTSTRATVVGMGAGEMGDADRKLRVLCLHGFTQNGETFRQRTGSIRKQLKKKIDFVFIDAPHDASGAFGDDDASALGTAGDGVGPRAWWLVGENASASVAAARAALDGDDDPSTSSTSPVRPVQSRQMRGWDDAAAAIAAAVESHGPFDGVLGFSQGASAAALALALVPSLRDTVRFAILFSGFEPMDPGAAAALHAAHITARSLHVHGDADRMVSTARMEALASSFTSPSFFHHAGGHGVPFSKEFRDALKAFVFDDTDTAVSAKCDPPPPASVPVGKPRHSLTPTRFLFVNGVGPCVGVSTERVAECFGEFGDVDRVDVFDPSMARCVVTMRTLEEAERAQAATHETCRSDLGDRRLWVQFSSDPDTVEEEPEVTKQEELWCAAVRDSASLGVPGATLIEDFATEQEELEMLACVDGDERWQRLAKRKVLHYGYAFDYGTRDANEPTKPMPAFVNEILTRAAALNAPGAGECLDCDQLTVNEYVCGVGIAPHVDTHSAFGATIMSLSLAGRAVMEFRLHEGGDSNEPSERRAILMPPRSLLVLHGEARYRWLHYIPHRKRDALVGEDECETREERRVSFTFRSRREGACACEWPEACDSRAGAAQRLKDREGRGLAS